MNLRGGGEFGADWERAGRFASGRLKAYEALQSLKHLRRDRRVGV